MPPKKTAPKTPVRRPRRRSSAPKAPAASHVTRASAATSGLAPGMQPLNTYLAVANVTATVEFLERAFGFARGVALPDADGQLRYAEMRHGTSVVMLVRKGDPATATRGASALYTYVDDVDRQVARAREAGAGVAEAADTAWGDRVATVTDPDGYRWVLATFRKLVPFSQVEKVESGKVEK